ncbi:MAG TPA: hypothetical protein VMV52_08480 [Candidatus Nanopelagicaceae bacterium]|nr:hypothetical protein [Candidatus Nanopelagicaceae bacterium]
MATGKNKVERWIRVWFDDATPTARDLSGDIVPGSMSGIGGKSFDEVEMTGISEAHKNFLSGHWSHQFSCQFYVNDTASTGAHTVLIAREGAVGTLTIQLGSGAAPAASDPEWEGEYCLIECPVVLAGNKPVIAARFIPSGSVAPAWGVYV